MAKKPTYEKLEQMVKELKKEAVKDKRTDEALEASENRFKAILNASTDTAFLLDTKGTFLVINEAGALKLGKSVDELIGVNAYDLLPPNVTKHRKAKADEVIRSGKSCRFEDEREGIIFDNTIYPVVDTGGRVVQLAVYGRDITTEKRAEEELRKHRDQLEGLVKKRTAELSKANKQLKQEIEEHKQADKELQEKQKELDIIFNSVPALIWSKNTEGKYFRVNKTYCEAVGLSKERILDRSDYDLYTIDIADQYTKYDQKVIDSGKPVSGIEERHLKPSGDYGWSLTEKSPYYDDEGNIVGTIGFALDITKLKQAEEEKRKLEAQFQKAQKFESIGTLAGGIAHDFNNLLMGIQGDTSLMLMDIDSHQPHYERLKNIEKQIKSGVDLTSQLLGYASKGMYEVKPTNLNQMVEETSRTFGRTRKQITIHSNLAEDLFAIEADQGQIEQILLNLFINASDAMPGGGDLYLKTKNVAHKDMKSELYKSKAGNYVKLTVTDTGEGIDKSTMERIFDPFFTTKEMGRGTGLGLASVYGIVKAHGGYIDVESKENQGMTFEIYLPATTKRVSKTKKDSEKLIKQTGTILFVDDEAYIRKICMSILEKIGYRVLSAKNGQEAIELYRNNKDEIDIVLLDMIMPNMSGGEAYDHLKEINPEVKVLLSSGYSIDGEATEILNRGCDEFVQKPFNIEKLSAKISKVLNNK